MLQSCQASRVHVCCGRRCAPRLLIRSGHAFTLHRARHQDLLARASAETDRPESTSGGGKDELENPDSEDARKKARSDELRAQEKFMRIGDGDADCPSCGYHYDPKLGDPEFPVAKGTRFENLPSEWQCPVCGSGRSLFKENVREVAGFAVNQGYGFGTNSMTGDQKQLLIYGTLIAFFALFLLGYLLE